MPAVPPDASSGLPSELLERRPDIASAERQVASANAQIGVARAAYFPLLTLGLVGGFESGAFTSWLAGPSGALVGWRIGSANRFRRWETAGDFRSGKSGVRPNGGAISTNGPDLVSAGGGFSLRPARSGGRSQDSGRRCRGCEPLARTIHEPVQGRTGHVSDCDHGAERGLLANERTAVSLLTRRMTSTVLLVKALGGGWNVSQLPL